jgi:hypothetical protein
MNSLRSEFARREWLPETDNIRTWLRSQNPAVMLTSGVRPGYRQP